MRWIPIGAIVVTCAACQTQPDATPLAGRAGQPQTLQASCRDFAAPVTTGGKPERAQGQACEQPDGSWRVVQNT
ncbi:MAG: hypothetical protein J2P48_21360, partial [Alphaproteobacteria bacterium]|nr:hypothetical protein [Alphaproteobacteria bacterium]